MLNPSNIYKKEYYKLSEACQYLNTKYNSDIFTAEILLGKVTEFNIPAYYYYGKSGCELDYQVQIFVNGHILQTRYNNQETTKAVQKLVEEVITKIVGDYTKNGLLLYQLNPHHVHEINLLGCSVLTGCSSPNFSSFDTPEIVSSFIDMAVLPKPNQTKIKDAITKHINLESRSPVHFELIDFSEFTHDYVGRYGIRDYIADINKFSRYRNINWTFEFADFSAFPRPAFIDNADDNSNADFELKLQAEDLLILHADIEILESLLITNSAKDDTNNHSDEPKGKSVGAYNKLIYALAHLSGLDMDKPCSQKNRDKINKSLIYARTEPLSDAFINNALRKAKNP